MSTVEAALRRRYDSFQWVRSPEEDFQSGAAVYQLNGPYRLRVKIAPSEAIVHADLGPCAEADRLEWLRRQRIGCPEVVEAGTIEGQEFLVVRPGTGVVARRSWPAETRYLVVDGLADFARRLHGLARDGCPFDQRLRVTVPRATEAAALGEVDVKRISPRRRQWSRTRLATELVARASWVRREDVRVCLGTFVLSNVLIDPETTRVDGIMNAQRLGLADPYSDLASITSSLGRESKLGFGKAMRDRFWYRYGLDSVDPDRLRLYEMLPEFT